MHGRSRRRRGEGRDRPSRSTKRGELRAAQRARDQRGDCDREHEVQPGEALRPQVIARDHVQRFREHDEALLKAQHLVYDDEVAVMQTSRDARADLMHLFEADATDSTTVKPSNDKE